MEIESLFFAYALVISLPLFILFAILDDDGDDVYG